MKNSEIGTQHYTGKDAIDAVRQKILDDQPDVLRVITAYDQLYNFFTQEERLAFSEARIAAGISSRVIFTSEDPTVKGGPLPNDYIWVSKNDLPFKVDLYIYNDTVVFTALNLDTEPTAQVIKNSHVAESMSCLFDKIWNQHSSVL